MTTTTGTLRHYESDDPGSGYNELQFAAVRNVGGKYDDVTMAVSATREGVLVLAEPALAITAAAARQVAAQLVEAAAWVDLEAAKR
ncbi:MAG: hypothetical protein ACR2FP_11720 [Nocardioidaceae bacterium]